MSRQRTWYTFGNHEIELDAPRYTRWKDNMPLEHVVQQAEVGVWFSEQTRDYSENRKAAMEELMGTCEQLDDLHIAYEVLREADITQERLSRYRVILLPHSTALSLAQQQLVEDYLREGGKVLATGLVGREDELGFAHSEWKVGKWLGISEAGKSITKASLQLRGVGAGQPGGKVALQTPVIPVSLQEGAAEVLYSFEKPSGQHPAVIKASVGNGLLVWSAMLLGSENFEHDARNNTRPVFGRSNPASRRLFGELVAGLLGERRRFQPLFIPPKIAVRHYETTPLAKEGPQTFIHLYNGTGSNFVLNKPTPRETPAVPYPRVMREIAFEVAVPFSGEVEAHYVTPDRPDITPISLERIGSSTDGRWKVVVPARTLEAYGMVRLRPKAD